MSKNANKPQQIFRISMLKSGCNATIFNDIL